MKKGLQPKDDAVWATECIKSRMFVVRGQLALLDRDVAELYGVSTAFPVPRRIHKDGISQSGRNTEFCCQSNAEFTVCGRILQSIHRI